MCKLPNCIHNIMQLSNCEIVFDNKDYNALHASRFNSFKSYDYVTMNMSVFRLIHYNIPSYLCVETIVHSMLELPNEAIRIIKRKSYTDYSTLLQNSLFANKSSSLLSAFIPISAPLYVYDDIMCRALNSNNFKELDHQFTFYNLMTKLPIERLCEEIISSYNYQIKNKLPTIYNYIINYYNSRGDVSLNYIVDLLSYTYSPQMYEERGVSNKRELHKCHIDVKVKIILILYSSNRMIDEKLYQFLVDYAGIYAFIIPTILRLSLSTITMPSVRVHKNNINKIVCTTILQKMLFTNRPVMVYDTYETHLDMVKTHDIGVKTITAEMYGKTPEIYRELLVIMHASKNIDQINELISYHGNHYTLKDVVNFDVNELRSCCDIVSIKGTTIDRMNILCNVLLQYEAYRDIDIKLATKQFISPELLQLYADADTEKFIHIIYNMHCISIDTIRGMDYRPFVERLIQISIDREYKHNIRKFEFLQTRIVEDYNENDAIDVPANSKRVNSDIMKQLLVKHGIKNYKCDETEYVWPEQFNEYSEQHDCKVTGKHRKQPNSDDDCTDEDCNSSEYSSDEEMMCYSNSHGTTQKAKIRASKRARLNTNVCD